ncbi:GNAT family N-acetyltransferase [Aliigemmobacter aestuarii]|uniref:GNAT family N-acetyltransferase n=1 Tax=Aliigemmobacter aestuarii TaxID=1445661 RepID=A0A4S3MS74_9RHOB|nr:GNAT family N-acetyltransferase [Gemmobacter aestuarii]THD85307.1 GNAT family N-acetyltransferase [Gemmobacter aestuarii]
MTLDPRRVQNPHDWSALLGLIRSSFAYMDGRVDPPSSIHRTTEADLSQMADEGEVWVIDAPQVSGPVACMVLTPRPDCLYIGKVAVADAWRGTGLSRRLIDLAVDRARVHGLPALELQVRVELADNHAIYQRLGFVETGRTAHPGFDRPTSVTYRRSVAA